MLVAGGFWLIWVIAEAGGGPEGYEGYTKQSLKPAIL